MIIPLETLSEDILNNIVEAHVLQEGTDYGLYDVSLEEKVAAVKRQLKDKTAILVYSQLHETVNIVPADKYQQIQAQAQ
ncbi:YheU family protein [Thalassotalea sp. LPB0316]|uniref:YheU family protein n=1 Tax=Thalassotalea sp. LPB0316 TaxID=2769490 RepID=UPI001865D216|nr:YheU family protein [Thalassotalea sp. LPB0316]QOL26602.1 YheU family protein [Thalassotalea sp. LPB0316]